VSEAPENLIPVHLHCLDEKADRLAADVQELNIRMTSVKQQLGHLAATEASHYASLSSRLDCIERRLDLMEPAR
jgi:hypothetical protein